MSSALKNPANRLTDGLALALAMSIGFLCLSLVRVFGDMGSKAMRHKVRDSILAGPVWDSVLARNIALFALAVIALHVALAVLCWGLALLSEKAWLRGATRRTHWVALWTVGVLIGLLAGNAAMFPASSLGAPYAPIADHKVGGIGIVALYWWLIAAATGATLVSAIHHTRLHWPKRLSPLSAGAVALLGTTIAIPWLIAAAGGANRPDTARPNVILIGLDSLRADIVPVDGSGPFTPHLNAFLADGTRFTDALTPLARTFPAWVALLTGRHPHTTGALINLLPRDRVNTRGTLGDDLGAHGYSTVYAIDEVRFSNIDGTYGFEQVVTPPIGSTEFLLSFVGDTPLLNLLINTPIGALMFPHFHANRGAALHYDPDEFIERIDEALADVETPVFLATHLTLAHWPYIWAGIPKPPLEPPGTELPKIYSNAVQRVDQQFNDLLQVLSKRGLLDNAIVVVFSDHGEAFGANSELMVPIDSTEALRIGSQVTWGHGTSVLSPHQYRVVLGMRRFGAARGAAPDPKQVDAHTTLEDIAPTIHELLGTRAANPFDGQSLAGWLSGAPHTDSAGLGRVRFTETEFNPASIVSLTGELSTSAVADATQYYRVDPTTDRVELRPAVIDALTRVRQVAALGDHWLLAAIPSQIDGRHLRLAVPLGGGFPRRLESIEGSTDPELVRLWHALDRRFPAVLAHPDSAFAAEAGNGASLSDAMGHILPPPDDSERSLSK